MINFTRFSPRHLSMREESIYFPYGFICVARTMYAIENAVDDLTIFYLAPRIEISGFRHYR